MPSPTVVPRSLPLAKTAYPGLSPLSRYHLNPSDVTALKWSRAKTSLERHIRLVWSIGNPNTPLLWSWHHTVLCQVLERCASGELKDVIINIPPGCSKSLFASVFLNSFVWASNPSATFLTFSYSDANTIRDNLRVRSIVDSPLYKAHYGLELASDQWAKIRFDTTAKGWRIASSIGGKGLGEHPNFIIVDDPHKTTDMYSPRVIQGTCQWFDDTVSTRRANRPCRIIIKQRLHAKDLTGHVIEKAKSSGVEWFHLVLPMHFNPATAHPLDRRTQPGELLYPLAYPESEVTKMESELGPIGSAAQLEQNPTPITGAYHKREWFEIVDDYPRNPKDLVIGRGWDVAGTDGGGDYTSGTKMALHKPSGTIYILDSINCQSEEVEVVIKQTAIMDGKRCRIREEREPGSSGKKVTQVRKVSLLGYDYDEVIIDSNKELRIRPFRAAAKAHRVKLLRGDWNSRYLDCICAFPNGSHDDDVDSTSCIFNDLLSQNVRRGRRGVW